MPPQDPQTPLPGRWIDTTPGTLTAFALHPRRPWLALARHLPGHRSVVERHDLDTGEVTIVHEAEWLVVTELAWVDDVVALFAETGSSLTVRLCDAHGGGLLTEAAPTTTGGRGQFRRHPRFVECQISTAAGAAVVCERLFLRADHDAVVITRSHREVADSAPLTHPDGDRYAIVDNPEPGVERLVVHGGGGRPRLVAMPSRLVGNKQTLLAWTSPDAFLLQSVSLIEGGSTLWIVESDLGRVCPLWHRREAALRVACALDGGQVALLGTDAVGLHEATILSIANDTATRVPSLSGAQGPLPTLHWIDEDTLVTLCVRSGLVTLGVHQVASDTTTAYTLDDPAHDVTLVTAGHRRILLCVTDLEARYFLSDPLTPV